MPEYRARNVPFLAQRLSKRINDLHPPLEAALITRALARAESIKLPLPIARALELAAEKLQHEPLPPLLQLSAEDLKVIISGSNPPPTDAAFEAARAIYPVYIASQNTSRALLSERDKLLAQLLELQRVHTNETFYPDANGCLRLSAGHVEGYSAADAVFHHPVTTIGGLIDKHVESKLVGSAHGEDEFGCPERLLAVAEADARVGATPACICYSTDTGKGLRMSQCHVCVLVTVGEKPACIALPFCCVCCASRSRSRNQTLQSEATAAAPYLMQK
jgi:hypothetical protein